MLELLKEFFAFIKELLSAIFSYIIKEQTQNMIDSFFESD
jgi:hypothetical protein